MTLKTDLQAAREGDGMVWRVAKAISGAPFPSRASLRKARLAIQAMREPTPQIVAAINGQYAYVDGTATSAWRAGIHAALGESDGPSAENAP